MVEFLYSDYQAVHKPIKGELVSTDKIQYHYSCKHFDKENKICTIYEDRPLMCRDFNGEKPWQKCTYSGCTCKFEDDIELKKTLEKVEEKVKDMTCQSSCGSCSN